MEQINAIRNTIRGLDQLAYHDAKIFAAHTGDTLGEVISEAIRRYIYDDETIEMVQSWVDETLRVTAPMEIDQPRSALKELHTGKLNYAGLGKRDD